MMCEWSQACACFGMTKLVIEPEVAEAAIRMK